MRIILSAAVVLLLAGCGTTTNIPAVIPDAPPVSAPPQRGGLIGLDATALGARLGQPRFRVREGDGTKLQFAAGSCLLDAYLYPSGNGPPRVTHVDTRNRDGRVIDQAGCLRLFEAR